MFFFWDKICPATAKAGCSPGMDRLLCETGRPKGADHLRFLPGNEIQSARMKS